MRVSLANSDRGFSVAPDEPVLTAALRAGLNLPHGCQGGSCGACRGRLLAGEVHYPGGAPLGLAASDAEEGFILLCRAHARSDLEIDLVEITTPALATLKRLPARIERTVPMGHDVIGLFLRLPSAEPFDFLPGQYLDILLPGGRRRSFSIAVPPHDSRLLELHVRRVAGGLFSEPLFNGTPRGSLLEIEGPLGRFAYRPEDKLPLLLVGGGTGLAPLKSILRHVIETGVERHLALYWGVRSQRDLYADAELRDVARRAAHFRYIPVLSEPGAGWHGRRGLVHEAVLSDHARLDATDVYASGPPAMIEAVRRDFAPRGVDPGRLFFDVFDYATDPPPRQRSTASTRA